MEFLYEYQNSGQIVLALQLVHSFDQEIAVEQRAI